MSQIRNYFLALTIKETMTLVLNFNISAVDICGSHYVKVKFCCMQAHFVHVCRILQNVVTD
jgi:hypothetical protein